MHTYPFLSPDIKYIRKTKPKKINIIPLIAIKISSFINPKIHPKISIFPNIENPSIINNKQTIPYPILSITFIFHSNLKFYLFLFSFFPFYPLPLTYSILIFLGKLHSFEQDGQAGAEGQAGQDRVPAPSQVVPSQTTDINLSSYPK